MPKQMDLHGFNKSYTPRGRGTSDSVDGVQQKWYDAPSRRYFKLDSTNGYEGLVEILISRILHHSYLDNRPLPYVVYSLESVGDAVASVCSSFLQRGEYEVALSSWIDSSATLSEIDRSSNLPADVKLERIVSSVSERTSLCGLCPLYGATMLLDTLFLNEDRHWSNFSVIALRNGQYRYAPIFDNGRALKSFRIENISHSYATYEPRPYNADQLDCCLRLLQGSRVVIYNSRINWTAIRKILLEFYPVVIVEDYLNRAQTAITCAKQNSLFSALEVR